MTIKKIQFGLELEGGFLRDKEFSYENGKLKKEIEDYQGKIILGSDNTANIKESRSEYKDEYEFKSAHPIQEDNIHQHIEDINILFEKLDFKYDPAYCGLHIHFSPVDKKWDLNHVKRFLPNLFCALSVLVKFFKHRQQRNYSYSTRSYSNLMKFIFETLPQAVTIDELDEKYSTCIDNSEIKRRHIIGLFSSYDSFEIRCLPPERELLESLINIVMYFWHSQKNHSKKELLNMSIFDLLSLTDQSDQIKYYKRYYYKWLKEGK